MLATSRGNLQSLNLNGGSIMKHIYPRNLENGTSPWPDQCANTIYMTPLVSITKGTDGNRKQVEGHLNNTRISVVMII